MTKKCSKCKKEKYLNEFCFDRSRKDGLRIYCKLCCSKKHKEFRLKNFKKLKEKAKTYNLVHREKINKKHKEYRLGRKEAKNEYEKKRRRDNPKYKLRHSISSLIAMRLRKRLSSKKGKSTFNFLPYTIDELMKWLESKFKLGMTWSNYGKWHVDHIISDCKFEYSNTNDKEFQECWALKNLQPLWMKENLIKNKY